MASYNELDTHYDTLDSIGKKLSETSFNLMHINCRSLNKHYTEIWTLCHLLKPTTVALTETWLKNDQINFNFPGYKLLTKNREERQGGGVGFLIKETLKIQSVACDFISSTFEYICIKLCYNETRLNICTIYRPPNTNLLLFIKELSDFLSCSLKPKKRFLIAGDFNIDLIKIDKISSIFINMMQSYNLLPVIQRATRQTDTTSSSIDNIFVNFHLERSFSSVITYDLSDHMPILLSIGNFPRTHPPTQYLTRNFSENNKQQFVEILKNTEWSQVYKACDLYEVNLAYNTFQEIYLNRYISCFPYKSTTNVQRFKQEWMTSELLNACKLKSKLYKKLMKHPNENTKKVFITFRNKFKILKDATIKKYYQEKFTSYKNNSRKTWQLIGSIINTNKRSNEDTEHFKLQNNEKCTDPSTIANSFNKYFSNIGDQLAESIPHCDSSFNDYLATPNKHSLDLHPTDPNEIILLAKSLKISHSCGNDDLDPHIIQASIINVANILSYIINVSLISGVFPDRLKTAKIVPIYKSGCKSSICNYRPISLLPYFSKLFEKVICVRLYRFLSINSMINDFQFGFRAGYSSYMPIMQMYDHISQNLENNNSCIGIFFDLSKAFDTVNHEILLSKLQYYGIRNTAIKWFKSYLSNREQYVYYKRTCSSLNKITCGVPQGSILGPLLFIIYINDIVHSTKFFNFFLFADDTNALATDQNLNDLINKTNTELISVSNWFKSNKLSLNAAKTNFIAFHKHRTHIDPTSIELFIENSRIINVSSTKFLGVHINESLTWDDHISCVSKKISRNIGILYKSSHLLNKSTLLTIYFSFIYPYFNYCNIIWCPTSKKARKQLSTLQKRCMRVIFKTPYQASVSTFYIEIQLLKLDQIYIYQSLIFMYKYFNNELPGTFKNYFTLSKDVHSNNLRIAENVRIGAYKTNLRKFFIKYIGPKIWNDACKYLNMSSLPTFKKSAKVFSVNKDLDCYMNSLS